MWGNRPVFLCRQGCVKDLQANPDQYLGASAASPSSEDEGGHHDH